MDVAVPDTTSPVGKATNPAIIGRRGPRRSHSCPDPTMPTTSDIRKPVNAQPIAPMPCSSRAAVGRAAATAIASNAISVTRMSRPPLVLRWTGAKIDRSTGGPVAAVVVTRTGCVFNPGLGQAALAPRGCHRLGVEDQALVGV